MRRFISTSLLLVLGFAAFSAFGQVRTSGVFGVVGQ
jgi:hypothetical protein